MIAFVGDSITAGGSWSDYFPELEAENFGVGGDRTPGLLQRLPYVITRRPDTVVLLIGTNDIGHDATVDQVIRNLDLILTRLRAGLPETRIITQSILPRQREYAPALRSVNEALLELAASIDAEYLDLWPTMADVDGELTAHLTDDRLHLTPDGYDAWVSVLAPVLRRSA